MRCTHAYQTIQLLCGSSDGCGSGRWHKSGTAGENATHKATGSDRAGEIALQACLSPHPKSLVHHKIAVALVLVAFTLDNKRSRGIPELRLSYMCHQDG